ncbi:MAG TPA: acyltransferase [Stellaceae bacterium]|nr:acyltransferase [Stellaceae bacterium]
MERHNNFDALRLVAAIGVIFSHAFLIGEGRQDNEPLMRLTGGQTILGVVGVFVFFTISGFLVTQSFEATRSATRFALKRALRIYPGLLACLLVSGFVLGPLASSLAPGAYFRDGGAYAYVVSNFTMVSPTRSLPGVWFTRWGAGGVVDGPLWTLPCELAMYVMVLALGVLRALDLRVIGALIALGMAAIWFDTASSEYFAGSALWLLAFFASGMALYRLRNSAILDGRLALLACAGLALSVPLKAFILLFPLFGSYLVIYLAFAPWLKPFPAARFGDLSYGLYIYGWPVEQTLVRLNGGAMSWEKLFAEALPIAAAIAFLSWHLVEKRALRFKPQAPRRTTTSIEAIGAGATDP